MDSKNKPFQLSSQNIDALIAIWHGDGIQVIFDIMENVCDEAENTLLGIHPRDKDSILAQQAVCYAQRAMMQTVIGRIDTACGNKLHIKRDNRRFEEMESLLSAVPMSEPE